MFDQSFLSIYHLSDIVPYRGKQEKRYDQDTIQEDERQEVKFSEVHLLRSL